MSVECLILIPTDDHVCNNTYKLFKMHNSCLKSHVSCKNIKSYWLHIVQLHPVNCSAIHDNCT